jgi:hypothetical protein
MTFYDFRILTRLFANDVAIFLHFKSHKLDQFIITENNI